MDTLDGNKIIGYYVTTESYKILQENIPKLEMIKEMEIH